MSGSDDSFGEDIAALENVQQLESTDYLCEYTGKLAESGEQIRIITLALELADVDAAVDAFKEVSDQWFNASANANIRPIRERGTDPRPWITMPDDNAKTLATVQPDLSPDTIETVIAETADALRTLGLYNTVHGHLSPDDIYLPNGTVESEGSTVELGGFGLEAAIRTAVNEYEPTAYTAPELVDGSTQPTEQTDVYGLGGVTYFALTGRAPIAGADLGEAIRDGLTNQPSTYVDGIAADVDEVVTQALSPDPGDRYESPYAFHRAFLSVFDPSVLRPDDTDGDSNEEADTTGSAGSVDGSSAEEEIGDSTEADDTNERGVTRRAAASFLGVVALGGVGGGWYFSRWLLAAPDPAEETPTGETPAEETPAEETQTETTAQSITAFSISNPSGQDLRTSFQSDTQLSTIQVSISGSEEAILTTSDFTESVSGGTYVYEATYPAISTGDYTATLEEATDRSGNDGASGQSVTISIESTERTDTVGSGFFDDFDYSDSPENHGWIQINDDGNATASDSRLTAASGQPILVRPQGIASGEFTFTGLQNTETYFGLKIDFVGEDDEWGNPGYRIRIAQTRTETESSPGRNDVQLARLDNDGRELLETIVDQHDGNSFDLTVSREDETGQFNIVFNDGDRQVETTVSDSTYSSSSYFRVQFGGENQYIDTIDIS